MAQNKEKKQGKSTFQQRLRKPVFWYNIFAIPILLGAWNKFVHAIDNIGGIDGTKLLLTIGFMGEIIVFAIAAYVDSTPDGTEGKPKKADSGNGSLELLSAEDKEVYIRHLRQGAERVEMAFNHMAQQIESSATSIHSKINPAFDGLQAATNGLSKKINDADIRTGSVNMEALAQNATSLHSEFSALVETIHNMNNSMSQVHGAVNPTSYSTMDSNLISMNSTIENVNQKMREMETFLDAFQNLRRN